MTIDYRKLVESYIALWNLSDDDRESRAKEVFTDDVFYCDPVVTLQGRKGLSDYIGQTRRHFAGGTFRVRAPVDGHHQQVRFGWECVAPGSPVLTGFDVALLDGNRMRAIHGFFG